MIQVGDMVEMIDQEAHNRSPQFYPPVGTRGIVLQVPPFMGMSDIRVRWEAGSTSHEDVWSVDKEWVRKI